MRTTKISLPETGELAMINVTGMVQREIDNYDRSEGFALLFVPGSTGALTTIEYESGLLDDFPRFLKRIIPSGDNYRHELTWHDGNGHSHVRASLIGPSLTVPFVEGRLLLGTWQQIVFIELDNKPRKRHLILQLH